MNSSLQTLLLEAAENRGYEKGYCDGCANGRIQGRVQGLEIAKRQIAKSLHQQNTPLALIHKVTELPITIIEAELNLDKS